MRIQEHPILGTYQKGERVTFTFDGKILEGYAGEPIAMALKNAGVMIHRYTKKTAQTKRNLLCHWPLYRLRYGSRWTAECSNLYYTIGSRHGHSYTMRCDSKTSRR